MVLTRTSFPSRLRTSSELVDMSWILIIPCRWSLHAISLISTALLMYFPRAFTTTVSCSCVVNCMIIAVT